MVKYIDSEKHQKKISFLCWVYLEININNTSFHNKLCQKLWNCEVTVKFEEHDN